MRRMPAERIRSEVDIPQAAVAGSRKVAAADTAVVNSSGRTGSYYPPKCVLAGSPAVPDRWVGVDIASR